MRVILLSWVAETDVDELIDEAGAAPAVDAMAGDIAAASARADKEIMNFLVSMVNTSVRNWQVRYLRVI